MVNSIPNVGNTTEEALRALSKEDLVSFALKAQRLAAYDNLTGFLPRHPFKERVSKKKISDLTRENNELKTQVGQLEHDLIHDELTGLKTRKFLVDRVKVHLKSLFPLRDTRRVADTKDLQEHIGFLFCDIDHFKKVNDTLGHAAGDEVLRQVTHVLEKGVRDKDIVARFGGEEIIIALLEVNQKKTVEVAEKLRKFVEDVVFKEYPDLHVTISIGVASTEETYEDESKEEGRIDRMFDEYVRRSDSAVYSAKKTGRNKVVVWTPDLELKQHNTSIRTRIMKVIQEKRDLLKMRKA